MIICVEMERKDFVETRVERGRKLKKTWWRSLLGRNLEYEESYWEISEGIICKVSDSGGLVKSAHLVSDAFEVTRVAIIDDVLTIWNWRDGEEKIGAEITREQFESEEDFQLAYKIALSNVEDSS